MLIQKAALTGILERPQKIKYRKQSRPARVKCRLDGELPAGRKETPLAVRRPHPAAMEDRIISCCGKRSAKEVIFL